MSEQGGVFGAFGAVLGYIGAEAATDIWFSSLLWPQRSFSHLTLRSIPTLALLMPLGGPLHKAALSTFDIAYARGLLKGAHEGHMLGTSFFKQTDWTYTIPGNASSEPRPARNCMWARALHYMPLPALEPGSLAGLSPPATGAAIEKGILPPADNSRSPLRAKVAVYHLIFTPATAEDKASQMAFVHENCGRPGPHVYLSIFIAELSGIIIFAVIYAIGRSLWCLIWLAPLLLRFLSAFFALDREPLTPISFISSPSTTPTTEAESPRDFVLHFPQSQGGDLMLFTGPPALVQQFFRHYGHPVRNRAREILQLCIIALFAALFPLGLLASTLWMPPLVQYAWTCYQLYIVMTMHIVRYTSWGRGTSTESKIADYLADRPAILFGEKRHGAETVKLRLIATYHARHQEGRDCLERLVRR
ncbi:hypothetical protein PENDEC_c005G00068 [Penicillium decumbens]|uniref:Uncharacterized protein n=1 Tax=Penicillium decumbens TaxID=69771 RepID=A0A1V6PFU2_PENDC|nr:hypothetical protein PENDEC_c005G00068 [Penicillium decumbens]